MKEFMVEFTIVIDPSSKEFQALVPSEKKRVQVLLESGEMKDIWLKEDLVGGYFIALKKDKKELQELLFSLPLYDYLNFEAFPLQVK